MSSTEASTTTSYSLSARILTTSILSITFVVLLLLVLHLYARCVLRTSTTRPQISLFRISSDSQVAPHASVGVDRSVIDLIPTFAYEKEGKDGNSSGAECAICLSGVDEEEMVRVLPNCRHLFHVECIDMWLDSHCTCPVCRAGVEVGGESGLVSRLGSSLRRLMSRDRSGRRAVLQDGSSDLERQ